MWYNYIVKIVKSIIKILHSGLWGMNTRRNADLYAYIIMYRAGKEKDLLTGTSFLKLTPVGLVTVTVLATVVVVEVVTIVLT